MHGSWQNELDAKLGAASSVIEAPASEQQQHNDDDE
jgi:hypothetical protein